MESLSFKLEAIFSQMDITSVDLYIWLASNTGAIFARDSKIAGITLAY
jgi:hypothetical protein